MYMYVSIKVYVCLLRCVVWAHAQWVRWGKSSMYASNCAQAMYGEKKYFNECAEFFFLVFMILELSCMCKLLLLPMMMI